MCTQISDGTFNSEIVEKMKSEYLSHLDNPNLFLLNPHSLSPFDEHILHIFGELLSRRLRLLVELYSARIDNNLICEQIYCDWTGGRSLGRFHDQIKCSGRDQDGGSGDYKN